MKRILVIMSELVTPVDKLSQVTIWRLEAGLAEWQVGGFDRIVVPGGIFLPPDVQTRPIAVLMADWLLQRGVPAESILVEPYSRDTFGNIRFLTEKLAEQNFAPETTELTLLSHWQHTARAALTAKAYGWQRVVTKPLRYPIGLIGFLKECVFYAVHLLDRRGDGIFAKLNRRNRTH